MVAWWWMAGWLVGCGGPCEPTSWYADRDGDGFGDLRARVVDCEAPAAHVSNARDCDDDDEGIHPDRADEDCDGIDDDCDGQTDEDAEGLTFYLDADRDGAGNPDERYVSCDGRPPPLFTAEAGNDCDDFDAEVGPGQPERCNDIDDDCDGAIDEDAVDPSTYYFDNDDDGFGAGSPVQRCPRDQGDLSDRGDDCNDANVFVFPGAPEICNNIDDDCDGGIDDDALDAQIAYVDYDFDGWGAAAVATCAFTLPYGYTDLVLTPGDCDDFSPSVNPGTDELCNGIDDDCDGDVDDDDANVADPDLWYADEDDDGFGDYASPRFACDEPPGDWSLDGGDCAPADPDIHPDAPEVCNFVDDDCDDLVDDADPELPTCP